MDEPVTMTTIIRKSLIPLESTDPFYMELEKNWIDMKLCINESQPKKSPVVTWNFSYHGYTDDTAAKCIGDIFKGRLANYNNGSHFATIKCTKNLSNEWGLMHEGHLKYRCRVNVYESD